MVVEISSDVFALLQCGFNEDISDYSIEINNNMKGAGFQGETMFITLTHKITKKKNEVLVKQQHVKNGKINESVNEHFQNEILFYNDIWPRMEKHYKGVTGTLLNLIPKCIATSGKGCRRLVLENITQQGYEVYNKSKPFDDDHLRIICNTYGIFHAVSMALREQDKEQYYRFVSQMFNISKRIYKEDLEFRQFNVQSVQEILEYFDPIREKTILNKLRSYEESVNDKIVDFWSKDNSNWIILHGDSWSNNMMFKYNDLRKPEQIKLLDFQDIMYGSPAWDLLYCLYGGGCEETLNKLEDYLKVYHSSLSNTLKKFGLDSELLYSFHTLKEDWKTFCVFGFCSSLFLWKLKLANEDAIPESGQISNLDEEVKVADNMKDEYSKRIREVVYHMYNNDFL